MFCKKCFSNLLFFCISIALSAPIVDSAYIFGYLMHNPLPDESMTKLLADQASGDIPISDEATAESTTNSTALPKVRCTDDEACEYLGKGVYCDSHYGFCDQLHQELDLCRRDEQCDMGLICIFGKCSRPAKQGHKGARCADDGECKAHLCCARQHGERICKPKLTKGQRCFVPSGGLDYSLNELCPCEEGLLCSPRKRKHKRKENRINWRSELNHLRCAANVESEVSTT